MLKSLFNIIKKRLQHRCFLVNIAKFLRTSFLRISANDCFCISEIQTLNNVIYTLAENFIFNFRIYKIFFYLLSFGNFSSTEFMLTFTSFSRLVNISNASFSSSLNRLSTLSLYPKFVPIGNAYNLSSVFI